MSNRNLLPKVRCSHILLSYDDAIESSHSREIYFAVFDAKQIIAELKRGGLTWATAVKEHSACPHSWYRDGDLGWFDINDGVCPELYYSTLAAPKDELLEEPVQTPYGIHIITRTG
jgi:parvulin-like peptidyl-prolyl isomerase